MNTDALISTRPLKMQKNISNFYTFVVQFMSSSYVKTFKVAADFFLVVKFSVRIISNHCKGFCLWFFPCKVQTNFLIQVEKSWKVPSIKQIAQLEILSETSSKARKIAEILKNWLNLISWTVLLLKVNSKFGLSKKHLHACR